MIGPGESPAVSGTLITGPVALGLIPSSLHKAADELASEVNSYLNLSRSGGICGRGSKMSILVSVGSASGGGGGTGFLNGGNGGILRRAPPLPASLGTVPVPSFPVSPGTASVKSSYRWFV